MSQQSIQIPDGYNYGGFQIWGNLGKGGILSRGYAANFQDLSACDPQAYLDLQTDLRMMLARVSADERIQIQYFTSSDFREDLDRFEQKTAESNCGGITRAVRTELVERYRKRMAEETLIRSKVRIFFSTKIDKLVTEGGKRIHGFNEVFKVVERSFAQREAYVNLLLRRCGGSVTALDNMGHYREAVGFWSPSALPLLSPEEPDWHRTIQDLGQFSEISYRQSPDHGLCIDGYYYGVMAYRTMPRRTRQTTMDPFLNLAVPGLRVVVNCEPLSIEGEMHHEEQRYSKLLSNIDINNPSLESEVGLDKHRDRMRRLMSNQTIPFKAQILVLACNRTADGLDKQMEAVRAAIAKTGAEWYRPMLPTSVLGFYNCATPGIGPWVNYADFWHKIDDLYLANMLPTGSSPRADLARADWIADNDVNGLLGGRFFGGSEPLHWLICGTTGSGKSVLGQLLLLQGLLFRYIVVIDNGLSYEGTCRKLDPRSRPLIITSRGNHRFNVFDTGGNPLSPQHLNAAAALCHLLVGKSLDEDHDKLRHAILAEAIAELYAVGYRRWRNANPELHFDVCRETAVLLKFSAACLDENEGFFDAFCAARDLRKSDPDALREFENVDPDYALSLDNNPETEHLTRSLAFSRWGAKEFPTLSKLQDQLNAHANQRGPHQEIHASLATLLKPWLRDGNYGSLLDGPSNFDFGPTDVKADDPVLVLHIELGQIAESDPELLAVAGFLIVNQVRNHIMAMPRDIPKEVLIEEITSFLEIPNGGKATKDFYERMRKYSCQVVSVCQQYSSLLATDPRVARAIIGNASGLYLLRNQNRDELNAFSEFIRLPEPVKDRIQRFPKPEDMKGMPDAHCGFCHVSLTEAEPKFTIGKAVLSHEVEQLTSSSGADFEKRRKERNVKK
jgi:type IV secretory system conjugative DNA transfer VirD4/TraG family protein